MDIMTGAGLLAGIIVIAVMMFMGGDLHMFISEHAMIIIFGGSIAATMIRFPLGVMLHGLPLGAKFAFTMSRLSARDLVEELARIAEIARKQGPVGLEKVETDEPFLAKGIRYVADGYDLEFIRDNLERDRDNFLMHLDEGSKIYRAIGDCAPAFGMIGTLVGLINLMFMLGSGDMDLIGRSLAVALMTTFYGVLLANLILKPVAVKLERRTEQRVALMNLVMQGISMMCNRRSPAYMRETLKSFIAHHDDEIRDGTPAAPRVRPQED